MHTMSVYPLTPAQLDATRGADTVAFGGVTFKPFGERKGVRAYRGTDQHHIMGIVEHGANTKCVVLDTQAGERWIFDGMNYPYLGIGDKQEPALRHVTYAIFRSLSCLGA